MKFVIDVPIMSIGWIGYMAVVTLLLVMSLLLSFVKHGESKGNYNAWEAIFNFVIILPWLLAGWGLL